MPRPATPLVPLLLLLVTVPARGAEPVEYTHEVREAPAMHLHVVTVDLGDAAVSLHVSRAGEDPDGAGPWQTTLMRPSDVATRDKLDVAVNGDPFEVEGGHQLAGMKLPYVAGARARVMGYATSDGVAWAKPAKGFRPALVVSAGNRVSIVSRAVDMPRGARQIVGGFGVIVVNGRPFGTDDPRAPRTAVGVDRSGKRLVLLVVDGRRPG